MEKTFSINQERAFARIKECIKNGTKLDEWQKKFVTENDLHSEIEKLAGERIPAGEARAAAICETCKGTGKFSFRRLADDFQNIRGDIVNIKGTTWSFGCPEFRPTNFKTIKPVLLENPKWEFMSTETERKSLMKFFFNNT